jgi:cell fate (sporulation/competence/biofilm development) regulator YlbF (YheA/YmcA/DUF963 family)
MEEDEEKSDDFTNYHGSIGDEMSDVWQCANELADAVLQSDEYKTYVEAKEALKGNVELCIKLNEYRERNFKLQNSVDNIDLFEELDVLEMEFSDLLRNAKVSAFLSAELRVCRMTQEINATIAKSIDLELEY